MYIVTSFLNFSHNCWYLLLLEFLFLFLEAALLWCTWWVSVIVPFVANPHLSSSKYSRLLGNLSFLSWTFAALSPNTALFRRIHVVCVGALIDIRKLREILQCPQDPWKQVRHFDITDHTPQMRIFSLLLSNSKILALSPQGFQID